MKKSFLIFILFLDSTFADCIVQEVKETSAKLFCVNTAKTEYLENSEGIKLKVVSYESLPTLEIYTEGHDLAVGETLKNSKPNSASSSKAQLTPIEIPFDSGPDILEKINPFKSESLKVYLTALQLAGSSVEAKFNDNTAKIENTSGEFNSLPLDLTVELDFGGSGLVLQPNFQDKTGSITAFAKLKSVEIGGYFNVNNVSTESKIYDATTIFADQEENTKEYGAGILIRNRNFLESGELHTTATLGYTYSAADITNNKTSTISKTSFNAGQFTLDLTYFKNRSLITPIE